ncbi:MAG: glycosyltransferase [Rhodanobacteraceae bacterium]|nr:glycosyltransferase [Rhodanobacteraceae bacterium]
MKILVVATKSPWPPDDGGRLVLWTMLQGLRAAGHELMLIAPADPSPPHRQAQVDAALREVCLPRLVDARPRSWLVAIILSLLQGRALSLVRHRHGVLLHAVQAALTNWRPDVVHVEQLQAWAHAAPARAAGVPVLLRMQNVESSLWRQVARARWRAWPLWFESWRLQRGERRAMQAAAAVLALTAPDALALKAIAGPAADAVSTIAPAFPLRLPAAPAVAGEPALVLSGSAGWWPNRAAQQWFLQRVLPALRAAGVSGCLHIYGGAPVDGPGVVWHRAPADAIDAFPEGAIAVIPLQVGSGIRMRILEAWARGLAVVASPTAAAGLAVVSGRELLIADTPAAFVAAIQRLQTDPGLRERLIAGGRAYLARHHDPETQTRLLLARYVSVTPG